MKSEKKTKKGNLSSSTKFALTVHRTHHIIIQLFRGSEWNSVFIGLNPAQAIFLKLPLKKSSEKKTIYIISVYYTHVITCGEIVVNMINDESNMQLKPEH